MELLYVMGVNVPIGTHQGKRIVIGSDHRGFDHKQGILEYLIKEGYEATDVGTFKQERCDYPLYSSKIGSEVSQDREFNTVGIGICGSGIGILIPASKYNRIYPARCLLREDARMSRLHNNSNLLGLSADSRDLEGNIEIVKTWLDTPFFSDRETEIQYLHRFTQTVRAEENPIRT